MADRAISELTPVTGVNAEDSFVLQQNNRAMRLTGQILLNWLAQALDGHGGINSIAKTSTAALVDTYTITFADESTTTFTVTNGKSITSIAKTGTSGLVDTYTITFNDGTTTTFTVTNGKGITSVAKTGTSELVDTYTITFNNGTTTTFTVTNGKGISQISKIGTSGLEDTYRIQYNDNTYYDFVVTNGEKGDQGDNTYTYIKYSADSPSQDSDMHDTPDNWMGIYCGVSSTAPTSYQSYRWFEIKGAKGDTGDSVTVSGTAVDYAVGDDGTNIPSSGWQSTIPTVPQGKYLWSRTVVSYTDGTQTTSITTYSASRNGVDGSGSVNSVNNISPDANHNVTLPMDNMPTVNSGNFVKSSGVALVNSRHENSVAYPYDPEMTYDIGAYCIHENVLYQCIYPIEMGEAWDATHWASAVISEDLIEHREEINKIKSDIGIVEETDIATHAIASDQYVIWKGELYKASTAIAVGTTLSLSNLTQITDGAVNDVFDFVSHVDTDTVITNLSDIPSNSKGRIKLAASVSPLGTEGTYQFLNLGIPGSGNLFVWGVGQNKSWMNRKISGSSWQGWYSVEDTILPQKMIPDATSSASRTYTLAASARYFLVALSGNSANVYTCIVVTSSTSVVTVVPIYKGTGVTFGTSTAGKLSVTFASASSCPLFVFTTNRTVLDAFEQL